MTRTPSPPYLLFLGDVSTPIFAKTGRGVLQWRPELCVGQLRMTPDAFDLGLPDQTVDEAVAAGAHTLVVGVVNLGGHIEQSWVSVLVEALRAGLDLASGLHHRLRDCAPIATTARELGRQLYDVRHFDGPLAVGTGEPRSGRRLLTVGTDCGTGKLFTSLALERAMHERGWKATFRATGQTGILIAGEGIAVDAVAADFVSGAAELLSPSGDPDHWDVVEGQGSLFHPSFAGVTLGLVHGAQAEALVLCSDAAREQMMGTSHPLPSLECCVEAYESAARLTCPRSRCVGVSLNTSQLTRREADVAIARAADATGLPCVDPARGSLAPILDALVT